MTVLLSQFVEWVSSAFLANRFAVGLRSVAGAHHTGDRFGDCRVVRRWLGEHRE